MESKPLTFSFAKTVKKPNVIQTSLNSAEQPEEVDFVKSLDGHVIESTKKRKEYVPLVIPLKKRKQQPTQNDEGKSAAGAGKEASDSATEKSLEEKAAAELIKETEEGAGALGNGTKVEEIQSLSSNIAQGATIGEVSTLEDYDSVPVEEFGKALLRGMGWKDGDGVGKKGELVNQFEAVVRPKGLGLGASVKPSQPAKTSDGEEELKMAPGAYVLVTIGKEKGNYGQVSSLDGDGRALVKMAASGNTSSLPEGALQLVTKKDFKSKSRVINQEKYEEYRAKQEKEQEASRAERDERERKRTDERSSKQKDERREESRASKHRDGRGESDKHSSKRRDEERSKSKSNSSSAKKSASEVKSADTRPWVRPHLRVRCVDQKYKKGKYYKEKLSVVDVITAELCICEDPSGRLLEDVSTSALETVIPRHQPAHVMVVRGKHKGQVGELIERDQKRCRATVQLLPDHQLATLDYDDVCEFTGSLEPYS